jgi:hypothetical protein
MSGERHDKIEELFHAALALPEGERAAFLARACDGDEPLVLAVERLLRAHEAANAGRFLEPERIGRFGVIQRLGGGGMGEVFLARDDSLQRLVAVKVLARGGPQDDERTRRFRQEALAASALNHPNIVTVHEVGRTGEVDYMATEFVEGATVRRLLGEGALALPRALDIAAQVATALSAAHAAGIVHRDIKPENVMVRRDGVAKLLDFGIAKYVDAASTPRPGLVETRTGVVVGTAAYMSPEQARGLATDARTDVWSFGCLLYELLAGRAAFGRDTPSDTIVALMERPPDWRALPAATPPEVRRLLERCLVKDAATRLGDIGEARAVLANALAAVRATPSGSRRAAWVGRLPLVAIAAVAIGGPLAIGWRMHDAGPRWARTTALSEIGHLVEQEDYFRAYAVARRASQYLPGDPSLDRFWKDHTFPLTVETEPAGAEVAIKPYRESDAPWEPVGETPVKELRAPQTILRLRITKAGFEPLEVATDFSGPLRLRRFTLDAANTAPRGMVRVPGGRHEYRAVPPVTLADYWLDRHEVTNREFKEFVAAGGYARAEFWQEPFVEDGRVLSWPDAMERLRDATGRPGPATWELGTYPDGQADHPVGGVSWFEAAAYARFAGKELPTLHHWMRATGMTHLADILVLSNFTGRGSAPVGRHRGLSAFGASDMAGNVKEWCSTASGSRRYILGGGWNEPSYMFMDVDAQSPWDRLPTYGFRCAKYMAPLPADQLAAVPVVNVTRDYAAEKPADEALFRTYRGFYSYDKTALDATVDSVQEAPHWRLENVSFAAAYGGERVPAHLYLPHGARPPYQVVVYWPAAEALRLRSSDDIRMKYMEYLLRGGRAVLHPIYKGTYQRRIGRPLAGPSEARDVMVYFAKDLSRSIDYLETRPDVDAKRLAFYGVSLGATVAPVLLGVEHRFRAAVLQGGGLEAWRPLPEADPFHFAPHVRTPVLMVNGRYDFALPVETSQRALLRLLGTPPEDKRHVVFESGHAGFGMHDLIREVLDWLDRYLGPINVASP